MFYYAGMCDAGVAVNPLDALLQAIPGFVWVTFELTPAELGILIRLRHGIDLLEFGLPRGGPPRGHR